MNAERIWHYTSGENLKMILLEGRLRTSCLNKRLHKPVVWFTTNQDWDPSASMGIEVEPEDGPPTREQLMRRKAGLARIAVPSDMPGLISWKEFKRTAGIALEVAKSIKEPAQFFGSNVNWWRAVFVDVTKESWAAVQVYHGYGWLDVPKDNWRLDDTLAMDRFFPEFNRPILGDCGIYLQCKDDVLADRCERLFREVWSKIPEPDAQSILDYWQQCGRSWVHNVCHPVIACSDCRSCNNGGEGCSLVNMCDGGQWLWLCSKAFRDQPDAALTAKLAECLALVRLVSRSTPEIEQGSADALCEKCLASSWGFDCGTH